METSKKEKKKKIIFRKNPSAVCSSIFTAPSDVSLAPLRLPSQSQPVYWFLPCCRRSLIYWRFLTTGGRSPLFFPARLTGVERKKVSRVGRCSRSVPAGAEGPLGSLPFSFHCVYVAGMIFPDGHLTGCAWCSRGSKLYQFSDLYSSPLEQLHGINYWEKTAADLQKSPSWDLTESTPSNKNLGV